MGIKKAIAVHGWLQTERIFWVITRRFSGKYYQFPVCLFLCQETSYWFEEMKRILIGGKMIRRGWPPVFFAISNWAENKKAPIRLSGL
jgi:hypothetical protein